MTEPPTGTQPPNGDGTQPLPGGEAPQGPAYPPPASGPPAYEPPASGPPGYGPPAYSSPGYGPPAYGPAQPGSYPPPSPGPYPAPYPPQPSGSPPLYPTEQWAQAAEPPKKRRGLLITAIVLAAALLICAGGGTAAWLLLRNADGTGAESPSVAVNDFLVAVYSEGDVDKASQLVCRESRKRADIQRKVDQLKRYHEEHKNPRFSWAEPVVSQEQPDRARVDVTVEITTADEQVASEPLRFTVVRKSGWFVCEVQPG